MSSGPACSCDEGKKPGHPSWVCTAWKSNRSAFNGYRETSSDYSEVHCVACRSTWRTKASYPATLPRRSWRDL